MNRNITAMSDTKVYTVFFNDVFTREDSSASCVGILSSSAKGHDRQNVFAYSGAGRSHGVAGALFGVGIESRVNDLATKVKRVVGNGENVTLNIVGSGQGGVAACRLVQALEGVSHRKLSTHLALHNPVTLNSSRSTWLDFFRWTWANKVLDLQHCKHLKAAKTFYSNSLLMNFLLLTPFIPAFPKGCNVSQEALPGYNTEAQRSQKNSHSFALSDKTYVVFNQLHAFLWGHGTKFDSSLKNKIAINGNAIGKFDPNADNTPQLKESYNRILAKEKASLLNIVNLPRGTFSANGAKIRTTFSKATDYLNLTHKELAGGDVNAKVGLTVDDTILPDSRLNYSNCFFDFSAKSYFGSVGFLVGGIIGAAIVLSPVLFTLPSITPVVLLMQARIIEVTMLTIIGACLGAAVGECLGDGLESYMYPNLKPA